MNYSVAGNSVVLHDIRGFNLAASCECGQAFRWKRIGDSWKGVVDGRSVTLHQNGDNIIISPCPDSDVAFWQSYLDLDRDYASIERMTMLDPVTRICMDESCGIHVFNQPPFEALISFIISANNNISRITGIVQRLCELCGETLSDGSYAFPTPEAISKLTIEQLKNIGAGYRAEYISETSKRIASGYNLENLRYTSLSDARKELLSFKGVGPKVADCVLLFSLGHSNAFPMDVWMNRAMDELYFEGSKPTKKQLEATIASLGQYSGIIQQYIFHYARKVKLGAAKKKT